jgi:hypothetical protein
MQLPIAACKTEFKNIKLSLVFMLFIETSKTLHYRHCVVFIRDVQSRSQTYVSVSRDGLETFFLERLGLVSFRGMIERLGLVMQRLDRLHPYSVLYALKPKTHLYVHL